MSDAGTIDRWATAPRLRASGYRYPGSPPFGDTDVDRLVFRGRETETDALLHAVLGFELLVVFGRSGVGKSSVLNAGVFEQLRARGRWPVVIRLNEPERPPTSLVADDIEAAVGRHDDVEVLWQQGVGEQGRPRRLWDLLAGMEVWTGNTLQQPVLVFDQFEELFTLDWNPRVRRDFIQDLGQVIRRRRVGDEDVVRLDAPLPPPDVKVVLVLREDSLGELEALTTDIPQILHNRFRLQGLDPEDAERAIREPALTEDSRLRSRPFTYDQEATELLLRFLRTGEDGAQQSAHVDPSQLQVVCQHVERRILPGKTSHDDGPVVITPSDLGGADGLKDILRDYYRREVESLDTAVQDDVRQLCELGLVSRSGRRLSLEEGEIEHDYGVTPDVLEALIDKRLLRAESRVGSVYYELAHDSLVAPIKDHRATHTRRTQLHLWSGRLALMDLLLLGTVSGPVMGVSTLALRTRPHRGHRPWRPWAGIAVAVVFMLFSVMNFDPSPEIEGAFAFEPLPVRVALFVFLVVQPLVGLLVGLLWRREGRPRRIGWGLRIVAVVVGVLFVAGARLLPQGGPKELAEPLAVEDTIRQFPDATDSGSPPPPRATPSPDATSTPGPGPSTGATPPPDAAPSGDESDGEEVPDDGAASDEPGDLEPAAGAGAFGLTIGDCATPTEIVPCDGYHIYEAYALPVLGSTADPFDGDSLLTTADERCLAAFEGYVGVPYHESAYEYLAWVPTEQEWRAGARQGACVLVLATAQSARGD